MDILFDNINDLVNSTIETTRWLIKFGKEKDLKKLQQGQLYMKNLLYYNTCEGAVNDSKADSVDGKWKTDNAEMFIYSEDGTVLLRKYKVKDLIISYGKERHPVFCMFSFDKRNVLKVDVDRLNSVCNIDYSFTNEQIEKLESRLGEYALVINDIEEFAIRIENAFKDSGILFMRGMVNYNDGNSIERIRSIVYNANNIAFNKELSYGFQQEYRYLILNREVDDNLIIDIGDVSDITKIIPTCKLVKLRCTLKQHYNVSD